MSTDSKAASVGKPVIALLGVPTAGGKDAGHVWKTASHEALVL